MARLFDWLNDPQRQQKIIGARLNAEFDALQVEGLWTPAITFATPGDLSVSYDSQDGTYVKVGPWVHAAFVIATSVFTHTTAAGNFLITGLPFAIAGVSGEVQRGGNTEWRGITKANYTDIILQASSAGGSSLELVMSGSAQSSDNVAAADMPTGGSVRLRGFFSYIAGSS